ncbi:MAG: hypothetical protein KME26_24085 [Oscillatoria princeps RMCB-10]|nr:hypothetical protein [Oscillatoria princeps RMCB-10]
MKSVPGTLPLRAKNSDGIQGIWVDMGLVSGMGGGTPAALGQCRWGLPAIGVWTGAGGSLRYSTGLGGVAGDCATGSHGGCCGFRG